MFTIIPRPVWKGFDFCPLSRSTSFTERRREDETRRRASESYLIPIRFHLPSATNVSSMEIFRGQSFNCTISSRFIDKCWNWNERRRRKCKANKDLIISEASTQLFPSPLERYSIKCNGENPELTLFSHRIRIKMRRPTGPTSTPSLFPIKTDCKLIAKKNLRVGWRIALKFHNWLCQCSWLHLTVESLGACSRECLRDPYAKRICLDSMLPSVTHQCPQASWMYRFGMEGNKENPKHDFH